MYVCSFVCLFVWLVCPGASQCLHHNGCLLCGSFPPVVGPALFPRPGTQSCCLHRLAVVCSDDPYQSSQCCNVCTAVAALPLHSQRGTNLVCTQMHCCCYYFLTWYITYSAVQEHKLWCIQLLLSAPVLLLLLLLL